MTRWTAVFVKGGATLACLCLMSLAVRAQGTAELIVPAGAAPVIDGKIGDDEWRGSAEFSLSRGEESFGKGRIRRSGRQLVLAYRSEFAAVGIGVRFGIIEPETGRQVFVLVAPISPPRLPMIVISQSRDRPPVPLNVSQCDVRFDFGGKTGFTMEIRLPLDVLRIPPTNQAYFFHAEVWDLDERKVLGGYPLTVQGHMGGRGNARLVPAGDWGSDVPVSKDPLPVNPALALLEKLDTEAKGAASGETVAPLLVGHTGESDGRRKDAPLAALEKQLTECARKYPEYLSVHANLMRVLRARNKLDEALAVLDTLPEELRAQSNFYALARTELLYGLGRFEEGAKFVEAHRAHLEHAKLATPMLSLFQALAKTWALELEARKEDARKDDLPRVRVKTSKGDFVIELFEDDAGNAVANFITLVERGFYKGTKFHWVAGGRDLFGGDPNSRDADPSNDGHGDPGYMIEPEASRRLHHRFAVSFVNKRDRNHSEGGTFAIGLAPQPDLDGQNTVFGRVIEGKDVVRRLEYYDTIDDAQVIRKRAHEYRVVKRPGN